MITLHVVSVSGGKDSTVTLSIAVNSICKDHIRAIFCDTGNEHEITYKYLEYLEQRFGIKIDRLKADFSGRIENKRKFIANDLRTGRTKKGQKLRWSNKAKRRAIKTLEATGIPFLDLCLWKGRFPSRKAQFCTEELKTKLAVRYQNELIEQGYRVISWQGVRRDESRNRANAKAREHLGGCLYAKRPIVDWTAQQVFEYHKTQGIEPNPLYKLGMTRVGCMPCINVNKGELKEIAARFPDVIHRIELWEKMVGSASKRAFSTFRCAKDDRKDRREIFADLNINSSVKWSKTDFGGKQYTLDTFAPTKECASAYGLCE